MKEGKIGIYEGSIGFDRNKCGWKKEKGGEIMIKGFAYREKEGSK